MRAREGVGVASEVWASRSARTGQGSAGALTPRAAKRSRAGLPRVYRSEQTPPSHRISSIPATAGPLTSQLSCFNSPPRPRPPRQFALHTPPAPPPPLTGHREWPHFRSGRRQCHTYDPKCSAPAPSCAEEAAILSICATRLLPAAGGGGTGALAPDETLPSAVHIQ